MGDLNTNLEKAKSRVIHQTEPSRVHVLGGTSSFTYLSWLLCSYFHNDVPPEPQQNVSMAAVSGAITCLGHSNVVFILASVAKENYIQQDDNYRDFMNNITDGGLQYAYTAYKGMNSKAFYREKVADERKKHIIVVGAGMAGLAAAYELAQVGHEVTILEGRSEVGGRVRTFRESFSERLHAEAGAMRLPENHYLTKHYLDKFNVTTRPFVNTNKEGYLYVYGEKVKLKDWEENNEFYCNKWWPGWDKNLTAEMKQKLNIKGILDYYDKTVAQVKEELGLSPTEQDWHNWVEKWNKLSIEEFLRSDIFQDNCKDVLRPWPEEAIEAYKVSTYTPLNSKSLPAVLREELGGWWQDPLFTPKFGMDSLPKSFAKPNSNGWNPEVDLSKKITFGLRVDTVEEDKDGITVKGRNRATSQKMKCTGDAVILTLPLQILRQMNIDFPTDKQKALANITYEASTKLILQCKKRFWQSDVGQGGFTRTNLPIGQIHYPDWPGSGYTDNDRGLLLVYTWAHDALIFGSQPKPLALASAVRQIKHIHPEIEEHFEVGNVQTWYSDQFAQGAFAALEPFQYMNAMKTLLTPTPRVYLGGEALSWSNGWIQGALFSGLMQAFNFTYYNESKEVFKPCDFLLGGC